MVTKPDPLDSAGVDLRLSVAVVDKWLGPADYKAIIKQVPLKQGADVSRLKADIRIAAVWYLMRAELHEATPTRVRATLKDLHDKAQALLDALQCFPAELRPMLHEAAGHGGQDWRDPKAWLSPTANAEAELGRLVPAIAQAMQNIPVKGGSKQHFFEAKQVLRSAWKNATGKSSFTDSQRAGFTAFELALTSCLNVHLNKLKKSRIPAPL
jgi:hypothetical protein